MGRLAVPTLAEAAGHSRRRVRLAAVTALTEIGDQRGLETLLAAMGDPDAEVRAAAEDLFFTRTGRRGRLDRPKTRVLREMAPRLLAALRSSDQESVRLRAAQLLHHVAAPDMADALIGALEDASAPVRLQAAETLLRLGQPSAREPLARLLSDPDSDVRLTAAQALAAMADPRAVEAMIAYVKEHYPETQVRSERERHSLSYRNDTVRQRMRTAVAALGRSRDKRAATLLLTMLDGGNWDFLAAVVRAIGQIGDERTFEPLLPLLDRTTWQQRYIRVNAIHAVARLGGRRAVQPLIAQLTRKDWQEPHHRADICRALGSIGDPAAADVLANYLTWDLEEVRGAAKDALVKIGPAAIGPLIARLDSPDRTFRAAVSMVLSKIGPASVDAAIAALRHRSAHVRQGSAWTLGQLRNGRAVRPLLAAVAKETDADVRVAAAWALGELEDPSAIDALTKMLEADPDRRARRGAAQALGKVGDVRAMEPLLGALEDGDAGVRAMSAAALGAVGNARAIPPLEQVLKNDNVVEVRYAAREALTTLRYSGDGN
jgi:HEAT repeat protein